MPRVGQRLLRPSIIIRLMGIGACCRDIITRQPSTSTIEVAGVGMGVRTALRRTGNSIGTEQMAGRVRVRGEVMVMVMGMVEVGDDDVPVCLVGRIAGSGRWRVFLERKA